MRAFLFACAAALALSACSQPPAPPTTGPEAASTPEPAAVQLTVTQGWTRATPAGAQAAGGYLVIQNPTLEADRLTGASSPRAPTVEIHEMADVAGVMTMRAVEGVDVPATDQVSLQPGGLHLMFMGVTEPFTAGQTIPVTLNFQNAGVIQTTLEVRPLEGAPAVADTAAASPAAAGDAAAHGDHGN
jgi:copper(I)-binding protein